MRFWIPALALLVLTAAPLSAEIPKRKVMSYFSPNGGGAAATAEAIDSAQKTVDVAMYSITTNNSSQIFSALARATARGVKVRMIFNQARTGASNKKKSLQLEAIGVDVLYVTRTMHEKFAIIDGKLLTNGSANWSTSADDKHSENTQVIPSPKSLITAFRAEFDRLVSLSKDFDPTEYRS